MVTVINRDKPNAQEPEPLDYLTALSSMKGIRKIFNDQEAWYSNILWIHIEVPFKVIDFHSFEKSLNEAGTTDYVIISKLKEIQEWAGGNIKLYKKNEARNLVGTDTRYYRIETNGDTFPVNMDKYINEFGNQYKEQLYCSMYEFYEFCNQVYDYTVECLDHPFELKLAAASHIQLIGGPHLLGKKRSSRAKKNSDMPKSLINYLDTDDNTESLEYLKAQFSGQKGQAIAYMIFALKSNHVLKEHDLMSLFKAITADFGNIGTYESVRNNIIPKNENNLKQYKKYNAILYKVSANIHQPIRY